MVLTKLEYFKLALKNDYISKYNWLISFFTVMDKEFYETEFIKIENKKIYAKVDGELILLSDVVFGEPVLNYTKSITLTNKDLINIQGSIETTIGRAMLNYILLVCNFKTKVPYLNKDISVSYIENKYISKQLVGEENEAKENSITIDELLSFGSATIYVSTWASLFVASASEINMLPPPVVKKYKDKLVKEMKDKYGEDVFEDSARVIEFENKLLDYDNKYLEKDPANGVMVSGKVKKNARKRMYLSYGQEAPLGSKPRFIPGSLIDGWSENPEDLATIINTARDASLYRGKETQKGGSSAKDSLKATNAAEIKQTDCGSKEGTHIIVNDYNKDSLLGRYLVEDSNKIIDEDFIKANIGKIVHVRSFLYCKQGGEHVCLKCGGTSVKNRQYVIPIIVTEITDRLLQISLKKTHEASGSIVELDINELLG